MYMHTVTIQSPHSRFLLFVIYISFSSLVSSFTASADAFDWKYPDADYCLEVSPAVAGPHLLRIDIPLELREKIRGVAAYVNDDKPVDASVIKSAGKVIAAEVLLSDKFYADKKTADALKADGEKLPISLYLLETRKSPQPVTEDKRKPVYFRGKPVSCLARPYTERQFLAFDPIESDKTIRTSVSQIGSLHDDEDKRERLRPGKKPQHAVAFHWQACILPVDGQSDPMETAITQADTAWFVFHNNQPAGSWRSQDINREDKDQTSEKDDIHRLPGGRSSDELYQIDIFTVQRRGESPPEILYKAEEDWLPLPPEHLVSSLTPDAVRLRTYEGTKSPGLHFSPLRRFYLPHADTPLIAWKLEDLAGVSDDDDTASVRLARDRGKTIRFGEYYLTPEPELEKVTISDNKSTTPQENYNLIAYPRGKWLKPRLLDRIYLQLEELPICIDANEDLRLKINIINVPEEIRRHFSDKISIYWRQLDDSAQVLKTGEAAVEDGRLTADINIPLAETACHVNLNLSIDGVTVPPERTVVILPPTADFTDVRGRAGHIVKGGDKAVFQLIERQKAELIESSSIENNASIKPGSAGHNTVLVIDEYWGKAHGLEQKDSFETILSDALNAGCRLSHTGQTQTNTLAELEKFNTLSLLDITTADMVIWAVGFDDATAGIAVDEFIKRLHYLVQSSLVRDKKPVIITIPPLESVSSARLRRLALEIKETGLEYGIPVIDLYLMGLLRYEGGVVNGISHYDESSGAVTLPTEAAGSDRHWAAHAIGLALKKYEGNRTEADDN